jgi:hypothetical protein
MHNYISKRILTFCFLSCSTLHLDISNPNKKKLNRILLELYYSQVLPGIPFPVFRIVVSIILSTYKVWLSRRVRGRKWRTSRP